MPSAATAQDVVTNAMVEIGVTAIGSTPAPEISEFVLGKLNRLLDRMNADQPFAYRDVFSTGTLTPSLAPHTIGPTGTFVTTPRPVAIVGANLVIGSGTTAVRTPINIVDKEWWQHQRVRAITSSIPLDLYYDPAWPNGNMNFWPVPTTAYTVEWISRIAFGALALGDPFSVPPGYEDAITLTVAEDCMGAPFAVPAELREDVHRRAREARAIVASLNYFVPRLNTCDAGMPGGQGGGYDYRTGLIGGN